MCKKLPKTNKQGKNQCGLWGSSMGWCAWYLPFGQVGFAFSGLLSCNHLCLSGKSLFSCFNEFLTSQKLFSKVCHASPADYSKICSHVFWGRFETEILCCSSVLHMDSRFRLNLENKSKAWLALKVEKYSSAGIPVQGLEKRFKDEKISWCLYVIGTPLQEEAQRGIIERETTPGSSFHENLVKKNFFFSAASPLAHSVRTCPFSPCECNLPSWM